MKITKFFTLGLIALSGAIVLNSCDGSGGEEVNPAPTIDLIQEAGSVTADQTLASGTDFKLVFTAADDTKLKKIEILTSYNGGPNTIIAGCTVCDTTVSTKSIRISKKFTVSSSNTTEKYTISATDEKGITTSKSITITVGGLTLTEFTKDNNNDPFRIYNFQGPKEGAFNLIDKAKQTSNDPNAEKDLQDSVALTELANWPGRITSRNNTTFKKLASTLTYDGIAGSTALESAWSASGTEYSSIIVSTGDVLVANVKKRGTMTADRKVLIKIIAVTKITTDNLDNIQFSYKMVN